MIRKEKKLTGVSVSGSFTPVKNLAFVAREFFPDCNDEIVESYDGLYDDFGGDNYCVSANALYLGLTRGNDGCEPLVNETDEEYEKRVYGEHEDDPIPGENDCCTNSCYCQCPACQELKLVNKYLNQHERLPDQKTQTRVAEAVEHALRFQKFFRLRKEQVKLKVEVVEKYKMRYRFDGRFVQNTHRPQVRRKNGRSLGNHGNYGFGDIDRVRELRPVEVIFPNDGNSCRRIRIN